MEKESSLKIVDMLDDKLSLYLDVKESFADNDFIELFGDSIKIFGFLRKASKLVSQKRFDAFLKGFQDKELPSEEQIERLVKYIDNEQKAEFIADTMQKILLSKSSKSCLIMGMIVKDLLNNKAELTLEDLVSIDALTNFFDYDITNFYRICNNKKGRSYFYIDSQFRNDCITNGLSCPSVLLTLEKAVAFQLISKEIEVELNIYSDDVDLSDIENDTKYSLTSPGKKMFGYISLIFKANLQVVNSQV